MIVAFLITLFALWLILSARGRARIAATARTRPAWGAWLLLGFVLLMLCFWGMLVPGLRGVPAGGPFGAADLWRVAGVGFLGWAAVSGIVLSLRGRG